MAQKILALFVSFFFLPLVALGGETPWYRDAGEYLAHRSIRMGVPTQTTSMIVTDGKRFDANLGKRVSLLTFNEEGPATAWTLGVDAGMLASLQRYSRAGQFTFATNTFDGFFGAFLEKGWDGWLLMARFAHISAHLVDNSPQVLNPVSYSQFWEEIIVGKTFPRPEKISDWEIHVQGSAGLNHTSIPASKNPRATFGASFARAWHGPDSLALLASADVQRAGVLGQKPSWVFFAGFGTMNRPQSTRRPFRAGVTFLRGSDYRNQNYNRRQSWTTLELSMEF